MFENLHSWSVSSIATVNLPHLLRSWISWNSELLRKHLLKNTSSDSELVAFRLPEVNLESTETRERKGERNLIKLLSSAYLFVVKLYGFSCIYYPTCSAKCINWVPSWRVQVLSPNSGQWLARFCLQSNAYRDSEKCPFRQWANEGTAVLNVSSDLWQLDVYTWQARQILVTESCPPVMP